MKVKIAALTAIMIVSSPLAAQTNNATPSAITFVDKQNQTEVLGTDFIGTSVVTKDNQRIGDITNLVFDQNGHIELAVIGVGGFLGVGQKEVAVEFETLKSDTQNGKHVLIVDATKDQLKAAPSYKTLNDQAVNQRVADWRTKASDSWNKVKAQATQAYDSAKERVNEARQPSTPAVKP